LIPSHYTISYYSNGSSLILIIPVKNFFKLSDGLVSSTIQLLQNGLKVLDYEAFEFKINASAEESFQQLWIGRGLGFSHGL
jgi:hypothetical protein